MEWKSHPIENDNMVFGKKSARWNYQRWLNEAMDRASAFFLRVSNQD
jgi:hypothetical protein